MLDTIIGNIPPALPEFDGFVNKNSKSITEMPLTSMKSTTTAKINIVIMPEDTNTAFCNLFILSTPFALNTVRNNH